VRKGLLLLRSGDVENSRQRVIHISSAAVVFLALQVAWSVVGG
jgi:hypothetical protein